MRGGAGQSRLGRGPAPTPGGCPASAWTSPPPDLWTWGPRGYVRGSRQQEPDWQQTAYVCAPLPSRFPFSLSTSPDSALLSGFRERKWRCFPVAQMVKNLPVIQETWV